VVNNKYRYLIKLIIKLKGVFMSKIEWTIVNRKKISTPTLDGREWKEYPQAAMMN